MLRRCASSLRLRPEAGVHRQACALLIRGAMCCGRGSGDDGADRRERLASALAAGRPDRAARVRDRCRCLDGPRPSGWTFDRRQRPADDVLRRLGDGEQDGKRDVDGDEQQLNDDCQQEHSSHDCHQDCAGENDDHHHDGRGDFDDQLRFADRRSERHHFDY
jgi:hypothetical protein